MTATEAPKADRRETSRRDQRLAVGILTSLGSKAVYLAAPLMITPAMFRYLGEHRYGFWMAITALTGMAWFADLGLGNGLLTRLGWYGDDRRRGAPEIASAYATLGLAAVVMMVLIGAAVPVIPWARMFGVTEPGLAREASAIVLLCFGAFVINIPLALIHRVQYARRQVTQSNLWQGAGALLSVAAVLLAIAAEQPSLVVIGCAVLAVPVVNLLNGVAYFAFQDRTSTPRPGLVNRRTTAGLLRLGSRFVTLSLLSSIALNVDNPLAAHALGLPAAAHYAVVAKLFAVLPILITLVGMAIWPANGEALVRGEVAWVRRTTRRLVLVYGITVGLFGAVLVVQGPRLLHLWVGSAEVAAAPTALLGWLAAWYVLVALASPLMVVQSSVVMLRTQFFGWAGFLVLSVALKLWWVRQWGLAGLPAAGCVAYVVTMWPAAWIGYHKVLAASRRPLGTEPDGAGAVEPRDQAAVLRSTS